MAVVEAPDVVVEFVFGDKDRIAFPGAVLLPVDDISAEEKVHTFVAVGAGADVEQIVDLDIEPCFFFDFALAAFFQGLAGFDHAAWEFMVAINRKGEDLFLLLDESGGADRRPEQVGKQADDTVFDEVTQADSEGHGRNTGLEV